MKKNLVLLILCSIPFLLKSQNKEIDTYLSRFQFNKAIDLCNSKYSNSTDSKILLLFGQIYNKLNLPDSALIYLNKIPVDDQDYLYFSEKAISYSITGNQTELKQACDKLYFISFSSKKTPIIFKAIEIFSLPKINKFQIASELLEKIKEKESTNSKYYILNANYLLNNNKFGDAVTECERAIYYDSLSPLPFYMLGKIYYQNRSYLLSIESFLKSISKDTSFYPSYKELGNLYYNIGKNQKALQFFKVYCDNNSINQIDSLELASMYLLNKQYPEAEAINDKINSSNTKNIYSLRLKAYINCETDKNIAEGLNAIEKMFTIIDSNQVITSDYEYRGRLNNKSKNDSLAIIYYNMALNRDSSHTINYEYIAKSYESLKNSVQAATYYQKLIEHKEKPLPSDYYYMGKNFYVASNIQIVVDSITRLKNPEKYISDSIQNAQVNYQYLIKADTAFGTVISLSPNSHLGFIWKARSQRNLDPQTLLGIAIPYYTKALTIIEAKPEADKKKYVNDIVESYTYIAFYYYLQSESFKKQNNKEKSDELKTESIKNWQKVLDVKPNDPTALDAIKKLNK